MNLRTKKFYTGYGSYFPPDIEYATKLKRLLTGGYGVDKDAAQAIAYSAALRMADQRIHYHTASHVLAIIGFAEDHGIELCNNELLVLFFHDVICDPTKPSPLNEARSADLASSLLAGYVDYDTIKFVELGINTTARHTGFGPVAPIYNRVMDLDVSTFAWPKKKRLLAEANLKAELAPFNPNYDELRVEFLQKLVAKGFIYRTAIFKELYEEKVMARLVAELYPSRV